MRDAGDLAPSPVADANLPVEVEPEDSGGIDAGDTQVEDDAGDGASATPIGIVSGAQQVLDAARLASAEPALFANQIDFGDKPFTESAVADLSEAAKALLEAAQGSTSGLSHALSIEMLTHTEGAVFLKTRASIRYEVEGGKRVDYLVEIGGAKLAVCVARAISIPQSEPYTLSAASALLEGKLGDIKQATAIVSSEDAWSKQILHIITPTAEHVETLRTAYAALDAATRDNTIVIITQTEGDDGSLY